MPSEKLSDFEKEILKEVGNMCAGNATTALAQILGRRIGLEIPKIKITQMGELAKLLGHPEENIVGIHMQILGSVRGNALLIFPKRSAYLLVDILVGPLPEEKERLTEIGISALKEMGNIMISAYLNAFSIFSGIPVFPSIVNLADGAIKTVLQLALIGFGKENSKSAILVEALFREEKKGLSGNFFIAFDYQSIRTLLKEAKTMVAKKETK